LFLFFKPENLLIDTEKNLIKLIDFGDAIALGQMGSSVERTANDVEFLSPEVLTNDAVHYSTDVWPVGVLTFLLFSGISPFLDETDAETSRNICSIDYMFPVEYFTDKLSLVKNFIKSIFVKNPK
jgi:serine/threonine protein kinase